MTTDNKNVFLFCFFDQCFYFLFYEIEKELFKLTYSLFDTEEEKRLYFTFCISKRKPITSLSFFNSQFHKGESNDQRIHN